MDHSTTVGHSTTKLPSLRPWYMRNASTWVSMSFSTASANSLRSRAPYSPPPRVDHRLISHSTSRHRVDFAMRSLNVDASCLFAKPFHMLARTVRLHKTSAVFLNIFGNTAHRGLFIVERHHRGSITHKLHHRRSTFSKRTPLQGITPPPWMIN